MKTDDSLAKIIVRGDRFAPEFGGGTNVAETPGTRWNSEGRFPMWVKVSGGTFLNGIFLYVQPAGAATPANANVTVKPTDATTGTSPATLTFDNVIQAGTTTLVTSAAGPAIPAGFSVGDPPVFYNLATTALFSGFVKVCIDFSGVTFPGTSNLRIVHFENGVWVDVTLPGSPSGNVVCGEVSSLSPFAGARLPVVLDVALSPSVLWPPNNQMVAITAGMQASTLCSGPTPLISLISITSNEPLKQDDIQGAVFGTDCRKFQLRAARLGHGYGRWYAVIYRATDACGNSSYRFGKVIVPHDTGKR